MRRDYMPAAKIVAVAVAITLVSIAIKLAIFYAAGSNAGFVVYIPAVAVAAWYRGFLAGILVTILIAMADTLLFLPPLFIIAVGVLDEQIRLIAFLVGGTAVSYLSYRLRSERDKARLEFGGAAQSS